MANFYEVTGGSGMHAHGMLIKHFASIGAPHWRKSIPHARDVPENALLAITYFFGSDGGPDEVQAKDEIVAECIGCNNSRVVVFVFTPICFLHIYHLMYQKSLVTADVVCFIMEPWQNAKRKYYSSLVKLLHTWLDHSKKMQVIWSREYGDADAHQRFQ